MNNSNLITIKQTSSEFSMSLYSIYKLIKTEPSFPVVNVGATKKFLVDKEKLAIWLKRRTVKTVLSSNNINIDELIRNYK